MQPAVYTSFPQETMKHENKEREGKREGRNISEAVNMTMATEDLITETVYR